jgi:hypothetical protein
MSTTLRLIKITDGWGERFAVQGEQEPDRWRTLSTHKTQEEAKETMGKATVQRTTEVLETFTFEQPEDKTVEA